MFLKFKYLCMLFLNFVLFNQSNGMDVFFVPYNNLKKTIREAEIQVDTKLKLVSGSSSAFVDDGSEVAVALDFWGDKYVVISNASTREVSYLDFGYPKYSRMVFDDSLNVVGYVSSNKETCMINGTNYDISASKTVLGHFIDQPDRVKLKTGDYMSHGFLCVQVDVVDHSLRQKYGDEKLAEMGEIFFKILEIKTPEVSQIERKGICRWIGASEDALRIVYSTNRSILKYQEIQISDGIVKVIMESEIEIRDSESNLRIADFDEKNERLLFHRVPSVSETFFGRPYVEVYDLNAQSYLGSRKFPLWGATSIVFFSSESVAVEIAEEL